jgi:epoxyqueuosine reductase QueG
VDAAARAGLGVVGRNDLLITSEYGSFVFIGEIVTDADYIIVTGKDVPKFQDEPTRCENCKACISACPGKCHDGVRASCLSAITQKKGNLTEEEISAIRQGGLAWGCDVCQLVCPHNIRVLREGKDTPIPYFREERLTRVDTALLDGMTDEAFASRAYAWRGRAVIRRNAALFEKEQETERSTP